jgi:hypothetical protein
MADHELANRVRSCNSPTGSDHAREVTCSVLRNDWARTGRWPYEHALIDVSDCKLFPQTSAAIATVIMRPVAVATFPFCAPRMIASCARNRGVNDRIAGIAGDLRGERCGPRRSRIRQQGRRSGAYRAGRRVVKVVRSCAVAASEGASVHDHGCGGIAITQVSARAHTVRARRRSPDSGQHRISRLNTVGAASFTGLSGADCRVSTG